MANGSVKRRTAIKGAAALLVAATGRSARAAEPIQVGCTVPLTGALNASGQQYHYSVTVVFSSKPPEDTTTTPLATVST